VKRLVAAAAAGIMLTALATAGATASGPHANNVSGTVDVTCDEAGAQTIWVNFVASDLASENPALVLDENGQVTGIFKVSYAEWDFPGGAGSAELNFPMPGSFTADTCEHPIDIGGGPIGTSTLEGGFNP